MKDSELTGFLADLKSYGLENDIPNVSEKNARFLQDIIAIGKYKNVLEIGTASGYSTISMAQALRKQEGHITSIDFSEKSHLLAKSYVEKSEMIEYISLIHANALEFLPTMTQVFDFIFIDGMKRRSKDFLELSLPLLIKPGFIIIDDVIKYKEKMVGLQDFVDFHELRYNIIPIDEDDGVMMIYVEK